MTITYKLICNRKYNRVIVWVNGLKTLILTQYRKKSCRPGSDPFNNRVKFDDLYPFIRIMFELNNRIVLNFVSCTYVQMYRLVNIC